LLVISYIYILQGSVEMHFPCGGICNNFIIANCLQSVPVKEFWKSVNDWWRYGQKQSGTFLWPTAYISRYCYGCVVYSMVSSCHWRQY